MDTQQPRINQKKRSSKLYTYLLLFLLILVLGISFLLFRFLVPDFRPILLEKYYEIRLANYKNCGTINYGAVFPQYSDFLDNKVNAEAKINCFTSSVKLCNKAYLRNIYHTWESYSGHDLYYVNLNGDSGCDIKRIGYSTDLWSFWMNKTVTCKNLTATESSHLHYGYLDDSECR